MLHFKYKKQAIKWLSADNQPTESPNKEHLYFQEFWTPGVLETDWSMLKLTP
jgi:hypothetical protein